MEALDTLILSRIQFAANISFHILFPTITIALGWVLFFFRVRFAQTGDDKWMAAYRFWVKVFALSFAMGVVSGITMSFQFGTNWPGFMETVGNIAGPLPRLRGADRLLPRGRVHRHHAVRLLPRARLAAHAGHFLVAFGTTMSAFWIIVLNSWMHTPQGFEMIDGVAFATDWWEIIFNPSMPYRFAHMMLASSGLTVSFLIAGVSAFRWLIGDRSREVRTTLKTGVALGALLIPVQIFMGDLHGLNTKEYQPAKVAAMEGLWETGHAACRSSCSPSPTRRRGRTASPSRHPRPRLADPDP
jgi:cytochrome d ubiquinol oxidase subunit I